jgi:hypothetical protein
VGTDTSFRLGVSAEGELSWSPSALKGLPVSAEAALKVSIGKDWYLTKSFSREKSAKTGAEISEVQSLAVIYDTYEVDATTRPCLLIGPKVGEAKGLFVCADQTERKKINETYFLVNQDISNSPFSDGENSSEARWRMTIRGFETYRAFEKLMSVENGTIEFSRWTSPKLDGVLLPDFKITQPFPGAVSLAR